MATTKFKIRGMRRISIPASSATIGCNIAALRVKVIGLAPCSLVRSQIHPVYRTVLRHRIPRSTSFGTKRVAGDADLGQSPRTMDLWTLPHVSPNFGSGIHLQPPGSHLPT